ncbi:MAG TPA: methyltransferase domain-containing protein [Gaiellaceae bacterium]|nr:methyltransferase domain-containing protein [Gaiellaceae bacterium]
MAAETGRPGVDFGARAARYDELRPPDENWWQLFETLVREGDLRGRRVLEVGCGTGLLAAALAARAAARVWAVDAEPRMVALAKSRGVAAKEAAAESLPFKDGWFERAVLRLVVHLLDRGRALPELRRVLAPGGRVAIATFDRSHFDGWWLNRIFPAVRELDLRRFPEPGQLCAELREAGFAATRVVRVSQRRELTRAEALARVHGRHISSFDLLTADELAEGTARAERELPDRVEVRLEWALALAET